MKKLKTLALLCVLFFCFTTISWGQAPPPPPTKPEQNPIDGGLFLLAAAEGGYAISKLRKKEKRQ